MTAKKQFSVAIVGGGLGGLTLALGLLHRGITVHVYEAASKLGETGLGLTISPAAHRAMPLIDPRMRDTYDAYITTHADSPGYERFRQTWVDFVWAAGDRAGEVLLNLEALPSGQTSLRRADFLEALARLLPKGTVNLGKRLKALEEMTGVGVRLDFEDGSSAGASVVVGCDGIRSRVKQSILSKRELRLSQPRYSGMYVYRAVMDMRDVVQAVGDHRARIATIYVGQGAYAITYPIMRARKVNVGLYTLDQSKTWDTRKWVRPSSKAVMEREFVHMGPYVNALLQLFPDKSIQQWAVFGVEHVPIMYKSRVAILGDAAHATTPHQGAGAGQAIEDAHVLAELLADPAVATPAHAEAAFAAYDAVRRPRTQRVVASSRDNGRIMCLRHPDVGGDEKRLVEAWRRRFEWLWGVDVQQQVERARGMMLDALRGL